VLTARCALPQPADEHTGAVLQQIIGIADCKGIACHAMPDRLYCSDKITWQCTGSSFVGVRVVNF